MGCHRCLGVFAGAFAGFDTRLGGPAAVPEPKGLFASGILRQRLGGLPTTMRTLRTSPCFAPLTPVQTRKSGEVSHQTQGDGAIPQAQIETI